ncbi:hypothetical protein MGYG_08952 [Nannizzia gypsea CBS 118893]|uniref:Uncharacterized protein n=1 Tax=Arthroderma gypseum (strain ATCC MYA-4604 / CBS 118893) TaxID=535722 RepID=E5QYL7_ARTGP|nr:hypothetical protein MGYG_08952 [Nannizzia gypsea CBS 118893]EFQ98880.1 hypothetical protein MGYG_08952 [Nannizzia gypsea CBS 118893]
MYDGASGNAVDPPTNQLRSSRLVSRSLNQHPGAASASSSETRAHGARRRRQVGKPGRRLAATGGRQEDCCDAGDAEICLLALSFLAFASSLLAPKKEEEAAAGKSKERGWSSIPSRLRRSLLISSSNYHQPSLSPPYQYHRQRQSPASASTPISTSASTSRLAV